jgi:copper chaperone CopZ
MKQIFQVENVKCEGCASTLKTKLKEKFGEVEVNLEKHPREISLEIEDSEIEDLQVSLRKMGYPFSTDELGFVDTASTKAKSFVSCAVGKIDNFSEK